MILFGGRTKRRAPTAESPATSMDNVSALRSAGWDIPDPDEWWIDHPTPSAIKSALIAPYQNDGDGVCIKRLWIPHTLETGNYDPTQIAITNATSTAIHRRAIKAWFEYDINSDASASDTAMGQAKTLFNNDLDAKIAAGTAGSRFAYPLYGTNRCKDEVTACLALDWIRWDDEVEFEASFAKVKTIVETQIASEESNSRILHVDGYNNATHYSESAYFVESLLALSVYGVNPGGASDTWASDVIDRMPLDPLEDDTATYSPWHQANMLSLISCNGGGRAWGANETAPGIGGYEANIIYGATVVPRSTDTATGGVFSLVDKCLYTKTRWRGVAVEDDRTVVKSANTGVAQASLDIFSRTVSDTTAKARYAWAAGRYSVSGYCRALVAISPPRPVAAIATGTFAERNGGRWSYREDLSLPDSTFRVDIAYRGIDNWRETGDDRSFSFAIGSIGLVLGHTNRASPNAVVSNGVWHGVKAASGGPDFAQSAWWTKPCSIVPHHQTSEAYPSGGRFASPTSVANDPTFLIGTQTKPVLANGKYSWSQDRFAYSGIYNGNEVVADARLTAVTVAYELDTVLKKLTITDTITIDLSGSPGLYLGWHFSPSVATDAITNGFEFADDSDLIRVLVEPQGDFGLTKQVRSGASAFDFGGYQLPVEWHETLATSLNRIAENVGFTPDTITDDDTYKVITTIQANP